MKQCPLSACSHTPGHVHKHVGRTRSLAIALAIAAAAVWPQGPVYAQDTALHATAASAYSWRGITRHDKPVLHPALEINYHEFRTVIWGAILTDELDDINNSGLLREVDIELALSLDVFPYVIDIGYTEYIFSDFLENTREVFCAVTLPVNQMLDLNALLTYDMGAYKDFYAQVGGRVHGEVVQNLQAAVELSFAAAGNGFSQGKRGGFHDFGITLSLTHLVDRHVQWGIDLIQNGSLDKKVLPEQEVDTVLAVRASINL